MQGFLYVCGWFLGAKIQIKSETTKFCTYESGGIIEIGW